MLTPAGFKFCHITVFSCYKITRTAQPYQGGTEAAKGKLLDEDPSRHSKARVGKLLYDAKHAGKNLALAAASNTTTAMYEIEQCEVQIRRSMCMG
jgi:hypothetical protein